MRYHTSPLVMLGMGVRASCHSWARTILVYNASMKSTVTYAKRRCIAGVFVPLAFCPPVRGRVAAPLLQWRTSRCWCVSPLCMSAPCRLRASVSSSPSFAFPDCLNSPSAFSLWCVFLSGCSLTLSCFYARFISFVVAPGYRTPSTWYQFPRIVSGMSAIGSCPLVCGTVGWLAPTGWRLCWGCGWRAMFVVGLSTRTTFALFTRISRPCVCSGPFVTHTCTLKPSCPTTMASHALNSTCRSPCRHSADPVARCPALPTTTAAAPATNVSTAAPTWAAAVGGVTGTLPCLCAPAPPPPLCLDNTVLVRGTHDRPRPREPSDEHGDMPWKRNIRRG